MQKTALVTGGARRVGRAICLGLSKAGYTVAIHHNSSSEAAGNLLAEIVESGGRAAIVSADLADADDTRALFDNAIAEVGPIGLLVNNASMFEEDSLLQPNDDLWDRHFNIHVKAPSLLAALIPLHY